MTRTLDVLLIESEIDAGTHALAELDAAGHRVHRCYRPSAQLAAGPAGGAPMCRAITDGACPAEEGGIDVALLSGRASEDRPGLVPPGVTCALRNHIPLVADDSSTTMLGSRLAARANGDVVGACTRAAADGFAALRADILRRAARTLGAADLDAGAIDLRFALDGPRLRITVVGPELTRSLQQALGVRILDAVRAAGRVFGQVDVSYERAG